MEVAADGKACRSSGDQSIDSENGVGESDVGTSADRSGIAAENRYPIVTSNSGKVYAQTRSKTLEWRRIADLANLSTESCQADCCLRFLYGGHGFLQGVVCIHCDGKCELAYCPLQCYGSPDCRLDDTAFPSQHEYRFLIHDRDSIYSAELDEQIRSMGLAVVKIPAMAPKANAVCERLIGTIRRECLDFLILLSERQVRRTLRDYIRHYNEGRPHSSLGPGIPDGLTPVPIRSDHSITPGSTVRSRKVLDGLHHEYWLESLAA
jgi:Integrase core domain